MHNSAYTARTILTRLINMLIVLQVPMALPAPEGLYSVGSNSAYHARCPEHKAFNGTFDGGSCIPSVDP